MKVGRKSKTQEMISFLSSQNSLIAVVTMNEQLSMNFLMYNYADEDAAYRAIDAIYPAAKNIQIIKTSARIFVAG